MSLAVLTLKTKAETAYINIERVKLDVEAARQGVEAARAALDATRGRETEARNAFDEVLSGAESVGTTRKALRQVVENSVNDMIGAGLINITPLSDDVSLSAPVSEPKTRVPRMPRASKVIASPVEVPETQAPVVAPYVAPSAPETVITHEIPTVVSTEPEISEETEEVNFAESDYSSVVDGPEVSEDLGRDLVEEESDETLTGDMDVADEELESGASDAADEPFVEAHAVLYAEPVASPSTIAHAPSFPSKAVPARPVFRAPTRKTI
jgi:hypothetical protein